MRSPMIEIANYIPIEEKKKYSDLKVMRSAAGYYIGTSYQEEYGESPGSRDSEEYYETKTEAEKVLEECSWTQRMHP